MPSKDVVNRQRELAQARVDAGFPDTWRWSWNKSWFWRGPADQEDAHHSNHFRPILSLHPQTKRDAVPGVLYPFVEQTLTGLGIDPMVLAVHCAYQRDRKKVSQTILGSVIRELCRFRVPGTTDQGFKLGAQVVSAWRTPSSLPSSSLTEADVTRECTRGSDWTLSSEEVQIIGGVIERWRKLVPEMTDSELRDWLTKATLDNKAVLKASLAWEVLLCGVGHSISWLWVDPKDTKGSKASYTRDVGNLKAVLSKALASGQILPLAGAAPFKRRGLKFLTSAADRVALLEGYRTYVSNPDLSDGAVISALHLLVDASDSDQGTKVSREQAWQSFALSWNAGLDRMGMQTMKQKILGFTKTQHIQHQETMKWDDTSLTFYVKWVIESSLRDPLYLVSLFNGRRLYPSIESLKTLPYDRPSELLRAAHILKASCPRWWWAMRLPEDPSQAWRATRRGSDPSVTTSATFIADNIEPHKVLSTIDKFEQVIPEAPIRSSKDLYEYLNAENISSSFAEYRIIEMAATKQAIYRVAKDALVTETMERMKVSQD